MAQTGGRQAVLAFYRGQHRRLLRGQGGERRKTHAHQPLGRTETLNPGQKKKIHETENPHPDQISAR